MVLLREEMSKSRTGKHAVRDIVLVASLDEHRVEKPKVRRREKAKPVYAKGEAHQVLVTLRDNQVAVQVHLVKNLRGYVKGYIEVYDKNGVKVFRATYRKLKLRYSCGDPSYSWVVEEVAKTIGLPVKRANLKPTKTHPCR